MVVSKRNRKAGFTDRAVISFAWEHEDKAVTAKEIANEFDVTPEAVHERAGKLVSADYMEDKTCGSSAKVYWETEKGRMLLTHADDSASKS